MGRARRPSPASADALDYETLAELRYQLRRFARVREVAARAAGVEPQQYLLLLQVKGLERRGPVTIGRLAERLQLRHHSTGELVDRLVERDMLARTRDSRDRRGVIVALRPAGEALLKRLALHSIAELRTEGPRLVSVLTRLLGSASPSPTSRARRRT
jgi:DNA-binding MarR family transcriptional regulator